MKQMATNHNSRIASIRRRCALVAIVAATVASPAQAATTFRAIFTGKVVNNGESFFPTGLSPSDTFSWAVVFNPIFSPSATQTGDTFKWSQTSASSQPLYTSQTLTSPYNTGINGTAYNSLNTIPTVEDFFQLNNSTKAFGLQTGRLASGLQLVVDGNATPLINLDISGTMPGLGSGTSSNLYTFFNQAIGPSKVYSCSSPALGCGGSGSFETGEGIYSFDLTSITLEVPGPIGVAGLAPLLAYSRKIRRNLRASRPSR